MKREDISRAVGDIDAAYIEEASEKETAKEKNRWFKPTLALVACAAIAVTAVLTLRGGSDPTTGNADGSAAIAENSDIAMGQGVGDDAQEAADEILTDQDKEKQAVSCNEASIRPAVTGLYDLQEDDFVPLDEHELLDYYQAALPVAEILPELYPAAREQEAGIYCRGQERAAVYHDMNRFAFSSADGGQQVTVTLSRANHAPTVAIDPAEEGSLRLTSVNGRELVVFRDSRQAGKPVFYVQWMQEDTGWQVWTSGVTEEAFMKLLSAIVNPANIPNINDCEGELLVIDKGAHHVWIKPENGNSIGVNLPKDFDMEALCLHDRVRVVWRGEPATLGCVWPGQLEEFTPLKGEQP